jgi:hypothetical protein
LGRFDLGLVARLVLAVERHAVVERERFSTTVPGTELASA